MEKLILDKSILNEDVTIPEEELPSVELEEPIVVGDEVTQEEKDRGVKGVIDDFLATTYSNITNGESIVATLSSEGVNPSIIEIFNKIVDDFHVHVGMLQEAIVLIDGEAASKVEGGRVEGQEIIEDEFVPEGEESHEN